MSQDCKKKVIESAGKFRCEKCNVDHDDCHRRYILSATLNDQTGNQWFSFFDAEATKLLGMSAQDLWLKKQTEGDAAYNQVFQNALFKDVLLKVGTSTLPLLYLYLYIHSYPNNTSHTPPY